MPKKKSSALDALARHNDERRIMEDRGAELRRAAALELGLAVLDAGGGSLTIAEVKQVIADFVRTNGTSRNRPSPARANAQRGASPASAEAGATVEASHG